MDFDIDPNEPVSEAVVRAVSTVEEADPCSLPPLAKTLDPDALNALFDSGIKESPRTGGRISFIYAHNQVTVDNGEYVTVSSL